MLFEFLESQGAQELVGDCMSLVNLPGDSTCKFLVHSLGDVVDSQDFQGLFEL